MREALIERVLSFSERSGTATCKQGSDLFAAGVTSPKNHATQFEALRAMEQKIMKEFSCSAFEVGRLVTNDGAMEWARRTTPYLDSEGTSVSPGF
jgi:hypothetical protein